MTITRRPDNGVLTNSRPARPRELQDSLNHFVYHPLAWRLARALAKTPLTPNMVSVIGGGCVVAAAVAYAQPGWPAWALIGFAFHLLWHVVDGADGDLARMTGRSSPFGEMVDGVCDYASHVVLYLVLGYLLSRGMAPDWARPWSEGWAGWAWMWVAAINHIVQANHVEVQRRQYQWWVYGTSWIRLNHKAGSATRRSVFGAFVSFYLTMASGMTPHALKIDKAVGDAANDPARLEAIRSAARREAAPLLRICTFLGPNPRTIALGFSMLAGSPLWYFAYQSVVQNLLLIGSVVAHNAADKRITAQIEA
jgi:hypothetical protein